MEQEKPRARRRAQHPSNPAADERFRVVVDDGDRQSRPPVSPSDFDVAQPYVGASTTRANDIGPPTMPSNVLPAQPTPAPPVSVGPGSAPASSEAFPAKAPGERKGSGWLLLLAIPVVLIGAGIFVFLTVFVLSTTAETPTPPSATVTSVAAPSDPTPAPVKSAEPTQEPSQQGADPSQQGADPTDAAPEPSGSSRKRPRKTPTTTQAPAAPAATTSPKGGPRSPVIF